MTYVDTSVWLRVLLGDPDRLERWAELEDPVVNELVMVEGLRTLDRLRLTGQVTDSQAAAQHGAFRALLARVPVAELSPAVFKRASEAFPVVVGTLDALHLATALALRDEAGASMRLATHDAQLARAGRAMGLEVLG